MELKTELIAELRQALGGEAGKALLLKLRTDAPKIMGKELTIEATALNGAKREGWDDCVDYIIDILDMHKTSRTTKVKLGE
jgi:hypothetical protein